MGRSGLPSVVERSPTVTTSVRPAPPHPRREDPSALPTQRMISTPTSSKSTWRERWAMRHRLVAFPTPRFKA